MTLRPPEHNKLDHDLYDHRRIARTAGIEWPGGYRAAAFILLRVQSLELDPPAEALRDPRWRIDFGNFFPEYRSHSLMEYGNRIGVFRLLDLLQPLGWHVAVAVNGLVAHEKPSLVRALQNRGLEIVAGGWSASRMISSTVPVEIEQAWLKQTIGAIADATGAKPTCYASQDYGYSMHTADLMDEEGLRTAVDWPNDEAPFLFGKKRRVVMLPVSAEMEDAQMVVGRRLQPPRWGRHLHAGLNYWSEQARAGTVLALPLHAWISGAAHRFTNLRHALQSIDAQSFWQAGPRQIDSIWRTQQN